MMTASTPEAPTFFRKVMDRLYVLAQHLDSGAADETALSVSYALGRITVLEREVAELKAQQSGVHGAPDEGDAPDGRLPLFEDRLPA